MRLISMMIAAVVVSAPAFAQQAQQNPRGSMYSSNDQGVQIQGNTNIQAENKNVSAIAVGENNEAKNTTGAIKGGTQIQGNTNIKAKQTNATAIAVGKGNAAANEAGVIGGK